MVVILGALGYFVRIEIPDYFSDNTQKDILSFIHFREQDGRKGEYYLEGGKEGEVIIRNTSSSLYKKGEVYLTFYSNDKLDNEIAISLNGRQWSTISQKVSYQDNKLPLSSHINGRRRFYLRLRATNNSNQDQISLKKIEFFLLSRSKVYLTRNLAYLAIALSSLYFVLRLLSLSAAKSLFITLILALLSFLLISFVPAALDFTPNILLLILSVYLLIIYQRRVPVPTNLYIFLFLSAALYLSYNNNSLVYEVPLIKLGVLLVILGKGIDRLNFPTNENMKRVSSFLERHKYPLLLLVVMIYGSYLRFNALSNMVNGGAAMVPDALAYNELVQGFRFTNFYGASYREPLPIAAMKINYMIIKSFGLFDVWMARNFLPLRSFSFLYSVLVILMTYILAKGLIDKRIGIIASSLVATNYFLTYNSTLGLPTEFYLVLLLLFFYLLFIECKVAFNNKLILIGVFMGMLLLTRSSSPYLIVLSLAYAALQDRRFRTPKIILPFSVAILMALPFFLNCQEVYGEYDYIARNNAVWWRNWEFRDQVGFIREEEFEKNSIAGERLTPFDYYFRYHTPLEVIKRTALGYHYSFDQRLTLFDKLLMPLAVMGLFFLGISKYRLGTVLWVLMIFPYAFIMILNAPERYTYEPYPLLAIALSFALVMLTNVISGKRRDVAIN